MGKVILDMSLSLDGIIARADDYRLHNWYFDPPDEASRQIVDRLIASSGSIVMGRRSYDLAMQFGGFADNPYKVPHIVITHHPPGAIPEGDTPFTFVTDGIASAIKQARAAAGDRLAVIGGGADVARQCVGAGLVDELHLHMVHVIMGGGVRLFDTLPAPVALAQIERIESPGVTHLKFRTMS